MTRKIFHRVASAVFAAALLPIASCGSDGDSSSAAPPEADNGALTVVAEDIGFPSESYRAAVGTVDIVYENDGSIVHTLVIEGVDDFKLSVESNGDVANGSVDLESGTYVIYCDVPGHRAAGMEATLDVD